MKKAFISSVGIIGVSALAAVFAANQLIKNKTIKNPFAGDIPPVAEETENCITSKAYIVDGGDKTSPAFAEKVGDIFRRVRGEEFYSKFGEGTPNTADINLEERAVTFNICSAENPAALVLSTGCVHHEVDSATPFPSVAAVHVFKSVFGQQVPIGNRSWHEDDSNLRITVCTPGIEIQ